MAVINTSPIEAYYSLRDWVYAGYSSKSFGCVLTSLAYIALLLWFTHVDIIHQWANNIQVNGVQASQLLVLKHASFLTLITNWGLLLMLYLDLTISKRVNSPQVITLLNIFGFLAILCSFGCAAGHAVGAEAASKLGLFINPEFSQVSLLAFAAILCYLKYISIKPQEQ